MKQRLLFLLKTYIFWICLFIVAKLAFLLYQFNLTSELNPFYGLNSIWHGLIMDSAMTSYVIMLYSTILALTFFLSNKWLIKIFKITNVIISSLFILVLVVDLEIYRNWGFHLDITPFQYLKTPSEAAASANIPMFILDIIIYTIATFVSIKLFNKHIIGSLHNAKPIKYYTTPLYLIIGGLMIIPARGGVDVQPMNTSFVYHSSNIYENHVAVNPVWNFLYALDHMDNFDNNYNYTSNSEAEALVKHMLIDDTKAPKIINTDRPNVVLIILESFTHDLLTMPDVVPNLTKLTEEGIYFKNCYSTADRSDKGLSAILSAFPALPGDAIIKNVTKAEKLPNIGKVFKKMEYHNEFFYGGDINFANLNSYLNISGFDKITTKLDFPSAYYGAKWGVHDEYMFDHVFNELENEKEPFFNTFFTLSSHEPFDVPEVIIEGESVKNKFLNTALYTDKHLGLFMDRLKNSDLWKNTVVILVADHGSNFINNYKLTDRDKYHIPMIWAGGAITQDSIVDTYCSQTDIIATLLDQLDADKEAFKFSKNILSPDTKGFAYYSYRGEGSAYIDAESFKLFDEVSQKFLNNEGPKEKDNLGRAYLQATYNYFLKQ